VESFFGIGVEPGAAAAPGAAAEPGPAQVDVRDSRPGASTGVPPVTGAIHATQHPAPAVAADVPVPSGPRRLDPGVVRAGFGSVTSPGRLEVVRRAPTVVVDAAHNVHGAEALAAAIADSFTFSRTVGVVGILADKDAAGVLTALDPVVDEVVITRSSSPRAIPVAELADIAAAVLGEGRVLAVERLDEALDRAIERAEAGAPAGVGAGVLVTGSVTMAGEARLLLGAESGHEDGATRAEHGAPRGRAPEYEE
jgi:dihydrofolate synthase/folylpolyglutamate synthase